MLRKAFCAVTILGLSIGFAHAEDIKGGRIMKIDDKKVTVETGKKKNNDVKTTDYDLAKDCKFSKMEKKEKVALENGIKNEAFLNINPKKGLPAALIVVTEGKVTEVVLNVKKNKESN
jgi:hypothetical protein